MKGRFVPQMYPFISSWKWVNSLENSLGNKGICNKEGLRVKATELCVGEQPLEEMFA